MANNWKLIINAKKIQPVCPVCFFLTKVVKYVIQFSFDCSVPNHFLGE
jgi:hypothetical protein